MSKERLYSLEFLLGTEFLFEEKCCHKKSIEELLLGIFIINEVFNVLLLVDGCPDKDFKLSEHHLVAH